METWAGPRWDDIQASLTVEHEPAPSATKGNITSSPMPVFRPIRPRDSFSTIEENLMTACEQLALAQTQLILLMSGQATAAIDTPQLGRVEFTKGDVGSLQRLIDQLTYQCAVESGDYATMYRCRRRPISLEAWP